MKGLVVLLVFAFAGPPVAPVKPAPPELTAWVANAHLAGRIAAWCRGTFQSGHPGGYAVAMATTVRGGRYLVLPPGGSVMELAAFTEEADLSCYTAAHARKLNSTIAASATIQGGVTPRWNTTVVCGFVDNTMSVCWQYSPVDHAFVKVGEWVT